MVEQEIAHELDAMTAKLEDYLLDDDLYKTITVSTPTGDRLIKMTLGGMLERLHRLEREEGNQQSISQAQEALERARRVMGDRYYGMLAREAKSYADSWNWFLQNCWEGSERCRTDYRLEVPLRLRLERLFEEGESRPELAESRRRVRELDARLREIWEASSEPVIEEGRLLSPEQYWWLYGLPKPPAD